MFHFLFSIIILEKVSKYEDDNKQRLSVWLSQVERGTVTEEKLKEAEELRPSIVLEDALWKNRFGGIWRYAHGAQLVVRARSIFIRA